MGEGTATELNVRRQKLIERPRLTRLLDESEGRIKMLIAPAGYGKTTLAHHWLGDNNLAAWYTATNSSRDVAALAGDLHDAVSSVATTTNTLLERLTVTDCADEESDTLAMIFREDLANWPASAWLVLDDYQSIAGCRAAERFVEILLMDTSINLLVLSRRRPSWASSRRILYGEVAEIGRAELAMTDDEARSVLRDRRDSQAIIALAQGWPAVLALAAKSGVAPPGLIAAPELHDFLADEIYRRIDRRTRRILIELALYETEGRQLALEALTPEDCQRVQRVGRDSGFVTAIDADRLEMHPLLRSFLEQKLREAPVQSVRLLVGQAVRNLVAQGLWDEAFAIIDRFGEHDLIPHLIERSLQSLLHKGRLTTLKTWMVKAPKDSCWVKLAAAELAFREGRFHESQALAGLAARCAISDADLCAQSWIATGRAAHGASHEEEALDAYRLARSLTSDPLRQKAAMYGELGAAVELELEDDAVHLLELLERSDPQEPEDRVILADKRITLETHFGHAVGLDRGREARQLLHFADPIARCSFRNVFGYVLAAGGNFVEAFEITEEQDEDAGRFRLGFVLPYTLTVRAITQIGQRDYANADVSLTEAEARAAAAGDETARLVTWAVRAQLNNAQGSHELNLRKPAPTIDERTRPVHFEIIASHALAYAATGHVDRARETAHLATASSVGVETQITAACARSICAQREGLHDEALREAQVSLRLASRTGILSPFVCAYRGSPEIVMTLLADKECHSDLEIVMTKFDDSGPAGGTGVPYGSIRTLSRREKEVLSLLARGLTNREIGLTLFISPATVKVHIRHIFEKLGVKSRAEAALRASQLGR